jgi:serine/threonine protein kinase
MERTTQKERVCERCASPLPANVLEGLCPKCLLAQGMVETTIEGEIANSGSAESLGEMAKHFPQFELIELLGRGGMGVVHKARQPSLDRFIALKILPVETGRNPAFAERFSREARALARLSHPGIVSIYDFGQAGPYYFFAMQYVDGCNLGDLIRGQKIAPAQALSIVTQICEALQYAHEEGVVHRDIKPGNILIDKKGRVRIADFGLAKLLGQTMPEPTLTAPDLVMGTPNYMAPEQIDHPSQVDHRADIYSLGVVFYELLTGELPRGHFAPPSKKVQIDIRLDEVVLRTLEVEPDRRYQSAVAVKSDVEKITAQDFEPRGAPAVPSDKVKEAQKAAWRRFYRIVFLGFLAMWLVPVAVWNWRSAGLMLSIATLSAFFCWVLRKALLIFFAERMETVESIQKDFVLGKLFH